MEKIENALLEINKTLKEIRDIKREWLDFEKMTDSRDKSILKGLGEAGDVTKVFGNKMLKMMGMEEGINIDGIDGIEEDQITKE